MNIYEHTHGAFLKKIFSNILNSLKKLCYNFFHPQGEECGIAYHYPIYGDRSLIGRSPIALHFIVDTCTSLSRSLTLFSASRWHCRAGWLMPTRTRTMVVLNKI